MEKEHSDGFGSLLLLLLALFLVICCLELGSIGDTAAAKANEQAELVHDANLASTATAASNHAAGSKYKQ